MKLFQIFSLLLISAISAFATLPDQLPLNREDGIIYAIASASYVDREVSTGPIGQIQLFSKQGQSIPSFARIHIVAPANSKKLTDVIDNDGFKFKLPTPQSQFAIRYEAFDKYQNSLLTAQASGSLTSTGVLPTWAQKPAYTLSQEFRFSADAEQIVVITLDPDGRATYHDVKKTTLGGKNYFTIPTWWFDWSDFKNGLTTAYGSDEKGNYQYREYSNINGKVAETQLVNYTPAGSIDNHFIVNPSNPGSGNTSEVKISIPTWGNYIQNPTFELMATNSVRWIVLNTNTIQGIQPLGVAITEQDQAGNVQRTEKSMSQGADFSSYLFAPKPGYAYFFRFIWGSELTSVDGGRG